MPTRDAHARWESTLREGKGTLWTQSGTVELPYSFGSRFEDGDGTNPEELIAAALSGCYSMALANELDKAGYAPDSVETSTAVHLEKGDDGFSIPRIDLETTAAVLDIDDAEFQQIAHATGKACPVSKVLTGAEINVRAVLES